MKIELEYQWDLLEEEVSTIFEELLQSIKDELLGLKSLMNGNMIILKDTLPTNTN